MQTYKPTKQEWVMGAIYLLGRRRRFDGETLTRLLVERAKLPEREARLIAPHWLGSYRAHPRAIAA